MIIKNDQETPDIFDTWNQPLKKEPDLKEIVDPTVQHMTMRYSLFYADDIVQESIITKSKVKYQLDAQNNSDLDEEFKIGLR